MFASLKNPASRLANRTANNRTLLRPNTGVRSAVERLLLQVLDPAASSGQKPVRINVDQVQLPKLPIQFDNNFVVSTTQTYKIMLVASPIVSAAISSDDPNLQIIGARSLRVNNDINTVSGFTYYVFNNKLGFLADLDPRLILTTKEDFRRFRMIVASMRSQWAGQEILKNGIAVTARLTDKENLSEFDPNQKPDCVISNNSDVLVTTCQHSEPVFTFTDVDENNDAGSGVRPNPETEGYATYNFTITLGDAQNGAFVINPKATTTGTTLGGRLAQVLNDCAVELAQPPNDAESSRVVSALAAKYGAFYYASNAPAINSFSCNWRVNIKLTGLGPSNDRRNAVKTVGGDNVTTTAIPTFIASLIGNAATLVSDATPFPTGNYTFVGLLQVVLRVPIDGGVNERAVIPQPIAPTLAANEVGESAFYDDSFLQPVTQVTGNGSDLTIQYQTSHAFEFVLSDTTVLGTAAVASTPVDSNNVVPKNTFERFQKVMKGMPPAHILTDTGVSNTTMAQMASRGIIKDIYNLAAPIAGVLFPGMRPIVNAAKPLVDAVDSAF